MNNQLFRSGISDEASGGSTSTVRQSSFGGSILIILLSACTVFTLLGVFSAQAEAQKPPTPTGLSLLSGHDTGKSNSDGITNRSTASPTLFTFTVEGSFPVGNRVYVTVVDPAGDATVPSKIVQSGETSSINISTDADNFSEDGVYTAEAHQASFSGGVSFSLRTSQITLRIDRTAPVVTVATGSASGTFKATATDANGIDKYEVANSVAVANCTAANIGGTSFSSYTSDNDHPVSPGTASCFKVTDVAGNVAYASTPVVEEESDVDPVINIIKVSGGDDTTERVYTATTTLTGTLEFFYVVTDIPAENCVNSDLSRLEIDGPNRSTYIAGTNHTAAPNTHSCFAAQDESGRILAHTTAAVSGATTPVIDIRASSASGVRAIAAEVKNIDGLTDFASAGGVSKANCNSSATFVSYTPRTVFTVGIEESGGECFRATNAAGTTYASTEDAIVLGNTTTDITNGTYFGGASVINDTASPYSNNGVQIVGTDTILISAAMVPNNPVRLFVRKKGAAWPAVTDALTETAATHGRVDFEYTPTAGEGEYEIAYQVRLDDGSTYAPARNTLTPLASFIFDQTSPTITITKVSGGDDTTERVFSAVATDANGIPSNEGFADSGAPFIVYSNISSASDCDLEEFDEALTSPTPYTAGTELTVPANQHLCFLARDYTRILEQGTFAHTTAAGETPTTTPSVPVVPPTPSNPDTAVAGIDIRIPSRGIFVIELTDPATFPYYQTSYSYTSRAACNENIPDSAFGSFITTVVSLVDFYHAFCFRTEDTSAGGDYVYISYEDATTLGNSALDFTDDTYLSAILYYDQSGARVPTGYYEALDSIRVRAYTVPDTGYELYVRKKGDDWSTTATTTGTSSSTGLASSDITVIENGTYEVAYRVQLSGGTSYLPALADLSPDSSFEVEDPAALNQPSEAPNIVNPNSFTAPAWKSVASQFSDRFGTSINLVESRNVSVSDIFVPAVVGADVTVLYSKRTNRRYNTPITNCATDYAYEIDTRLPAHGNSVILGTSVEYVEIDDAGNTYVCARAVDSDGNVTYAGTDTLLLVDTIKPTLAAAKTHGGGISTNRTFVIDAVDSGSGLDRVEYLNNAPSCNANTPGVFSTLSLINGVAARVVEAREMDCFKAIDKAGNVTYAGTERPSANDTIKPTLTVVNKYAYRGADSFDSNRTFTITASDVGGSGLDRVERLDNAPNCDASTTGTFRNFRLTTDGTANTQYVEAYQLDCFRAFDGAGNVTYVGTPGLAFRPIDLQIQSRFDSGVSDSDDILNLSLANRSSGDISIGFSYSAQLDEGDSVMVEIRNPSGEVLHEYTSSSIAQSQDLTVSNNIRVVTSEGDLPEDSFFAGDGTYTMIATISNSFGVQGPPVEKTFVLDRVGPVIEFHTSSTTAGSARAITISATDATDQVHGVAVADSVSKADCNSEATFEEYDFGTREVEAGTQDCFRAMDRAGNYSYMSTEDALALESPSAGDNYVGAISYRNSDNTAAARGNLLNTRYVWVDAIIVPNTHYDLFVRPVGGEWLEEFSFDIIEGTSNALGRASDAFIAQGDGEYEVAYRVQTAPRSSFFPAYSDLVPLSTFTIDTVGLGVIITQTSGSYESDDRSYTATLTREGSLASFVVFTEVDREDCKLGMDLDDADSVEYIPGTRHEIDANIAHSCFVATDTIGNMSFASTAVPDFVDDTAFVTEPAWKIAPGFYDRYNVNIAVDINLADYGSVAIEDIFAPAAIGAGVTVLYSKRTNRRYNSPITNCKTDYAYEEDTRLPAHANSVILGSSVEFSEIDDNGKTYICARAVDGDGNVTYAGTDTFLLVDTDNPTIDLRITEASDTPPASQGRTLVVHAEDGHRAVAITEYLDNASSCDENTSGIFQKLGSGAALNTHFVEVNQRDCFRTTDRSGNITYRW